MRIEARDREELLQKLAACIPTVAPRGLGRSKTETEPWVTHRLLPTLADLALLDFPLVAAVRPPPEDRPDVYMAAGTHEIGLEVIEAVLQWLAEAIAIRNKHYPNSVVSRFMFPAGYIPATREIHQKLAAGGYTSPEPPWHADSVERDWAEIVDRAILKKIKARSKVGFKRYPQNWLAVYSSERGPALNLERGFRYVRTSERALSNDHFDALFLLTDTKMLIVDSSGAQVVTLHVIEPDV